jgi:SAM-dependent methyltransferase
MHLRRTQEVLLWGGRLREKCLLWLLSRHYRSVFRRIWYLSDASQCFENQSGEWFSLGFDNVPNSVPRYFARGFFASEVIEPGDTVLDIGCGDGFFTKRFYAACGAKVDGIDIDSSALKIAMRDNAGTGTRYFCLDPTKLPLPRSNYDVIVWDGAIGHFPEATIEQMLSTVNSCLAERGVFMGSESLGRTDHGHLTFFDTLDDLKNLLSRHFPFVHVRAWRYAINSGQEIRHEAYWRCAKNQDVLDELGWKQ